jgi:ABC-type sugar transport system ATPase subunit
VAAEEAEARDRLLIEGLALASNVQPIDDKVRAGEIVGLAGLDGHGQEAFLETLCGLHRPASGRVMVAADQRSVPITSFRQAVRRGVAYLARDRRANGIFPSLSILDNFGLVSMDRDRWFGLIDRRKQRARYETYRRRLSIVAPLPDRAITTLSGGNQQKVLLARWLALGPRVLLLNDPTRGVDQRTRETLYQVFRDLARDEGMALVVLSTEIEELLRLCGRVLVFREKRVVARLAGISITQDKVIAAMFGHIE